MLQQHEALANQLRAWRKQEKLTQVAAAALIGMSPSQMRQYYCWPVGLLFFQLAGIGRVNNPLRVRFRYFPGHGVQF